MLKFSFAKVKKSFCKNRNFLGFSVFYTARHLALRRLYVFCAILRLFCCFICDQLRRTMLYKLLLEVVVLQ